jgi:dolichol-phosphate mannosyltransferase
LYQALVINPTYNEAGNIPRLIPEILAQSNSDVNFSVLVVDDHSPDGTADEVRKMNSPRVHLIERPGKMGLGTAYIDGIKYALENHFDLIIKMDADLSHSPSVLPEFVKKIREGFDVVIGSRYIEGISITNWPLYRLALSSAANYYARLVTGLPVRDATAGFICYRAEVLRQLDLDRIQSRGYSFLIEMKFLCARKGFRLVEIPIIFVERRAGKSKLSYAVAWEACWRVWKLRLLALLGRI